MPLKACSPKRRKDAIGTTTKTSFTLRVDGGRDQQYGVIHQLAYWGAVGALKDTLAKFPALSMELKTSKGQTAFQVAQENSRSEFVEFLQGWQSLNNVSVATSSSSSEAKATFQAPSTTATGDGFTFTVEPGIAPGGKYMPSQNLKEPEQPSTLEEAWRKLRPETSIEAMSLAPEGTVAVFTKQNLFAKAVHSAFYGHYPLILSPDVVWLTIAQGLANHVSQNAETLRKEFVNHEGKMDLIIERPEFVKGSPKNDWPGVFPEFASLIKANSVEGTTELIENDFSTTGPVERIVSQITLMNAVQSYFTYTGAYGCGFPSITLTGTPADWQKIRDKAAKFSKYGLQWWLDALLPALDQFVLASKGAPDLDFWRSLCNINAGGGSFPIHEPLTGWVQAFFPYTIDRREGKLEPNSGLAHYLDGFKAKINMGNWKVEEGDGRGWRAVLPPCGPGIKLECFPSGMASAPFTYLDFHTKKKHNMEFYGGITCLVQHPSSFAIEPKCGWAVLDLDKFDMAFLQAIIGKPSVASPLSSPFPSFVSFEQKSHGTIQ